MKKFLIPLAASTVVLAACSTSSTQPGASPSGADQEPLWSGPPLTTTEMSAADAQALDDAASAALQEADQLGFTGMWAGVYDPDRGRHLMAVGSAADGGPAATGDDHGRIGSVTKTFTATAVLQNVAAGRLSMSDTIADVLPDLAADIPEIADVTVEQLLGMTSGIGDYANAGILFQEMLADPEIVYDPADIVARAVSEVGIDTEAQTYSTTDYLILGMMVEKVTGLPTHQAITEVATDLGMSNTALPAPDDPTMPDPSATGYIGAGAAMSLAESGVTDPPLGPSQPNPASWGAAGGGMYSVLSDLGIWAGSGLGTATLPESLGDQRLSDASELSDAGCYGLGIMDLGGGWIGHTGQTLGFEALVLYNTETGAAMTGMVNEGGSLAALGAVVQQAFPDLLEPLFLGAPSAPTACDA